MAAWLIISFLWLLKFSLAFFAVATLRGCWQEDLSMGIKIFFTILIVVSFVVGAVFSGLTVGLSMFWFVVGIFGPAAYWKYIDHKYARDFEIYNRKYRE